MRLRSVLLVTYHFPPAGGSGVQRPLGFVRHLADYGWRPIVLCGDHARSAVRDDSLARTIPSNTHVERFAGMEPAGVAARVVRTVFGSARPVRLAEPLELRLYWCLQRLAERMPLAEPELAWSLSALNRARSLVRRFDVEAVITSGPPFSSHLIGAWLQRRMDLPWIAEFRDPLTANFAYTPRGKADDRFWRWLERYVVTRADQVVVTCPECGADLLARHSELSPQRMSIITNGFDLNPPHGAASTGHEPRLSVNQFWTVENPFVLTHVGSIYRGQSIVPIVGAFRELLRRRPEWAGCIRCDLVGSVSASQQRELLAEDQIFMRLRGYQPHDAALQSMRNATALYLTAPDHAGGRLCIPGKTFEYLASGKPILATIPTDTWLAEMLGRVGGAFITNERAAAALAAALEAFIQRCVVRPSAARPLDELLAFSRGRLTRRLACVLDTTAERHRNARRRAAPLVLTRRPILRAMLASETVPQAKASAYVGRARPADVGQEVACGGVP